MSRADKIASIIEKRRPLAQKIETVENNLRSLEANLRYLENHKNQLINKIEDANATSLLKQISFDRIYLSISTELETLKNLRLRFSRNTLNIGVVGLMRQGKSTLLLNQLLQF